MKNINTTVIKNVQRAALFSALLLGACASKQNITVSDEYKQFRSYPISYAPEMPDKVFVFNKRDYPGMDINAIKKIALDRIKESAESLIGSLPESRVEVGGFNKALQGISSFGSIGKTEYKTSASVEVTDTPSALIVSFINGEYEYTNNNQTLNKAEGIQKATHQILVYPFLNDKINVKLMAPGHYQALKDRRGGGTPEMLPLFDDKEAQERFFNIFTKINIDTANSEKPVILSKKPEEAIGSQLPTGYVAPNMTILDRNTFRYHFAARAGSNEELILKIINEEFPAYSKAVNEFERKRILEEITPIINANIEQAKTLENRFVIEFSLGLSEYNFKDGSFNFIFPAKAAFSSSWAVEDTFVKWMKPTKQTKLYLKLDEAEKLISTDNRTVKLNVRVKLTKPNHSVERRIYTYGFDSEIIDAQITRLNGQVIKTLSRNDIY